MVQFDMYVYYVYSLSLLNEYSFSVFPDKRLVYLPDHAWEISTLYSIIDNWISIVYDSIGYW